eukprot:3429825-Pyramimonas_sp.AAC.2
MTRVIVPTPTGGERKITAATHQDARRTARQDGRVPAPRHSGTQRRVFRPRRNTPTRSPIQSAPASA